VWPCVFGWQLYASSSLSLSLSLSLSPALYADMSMKIWKRLSSPAPTVSAVTAASRGVQPPLVRAENMHGSMYATEVQAVAPVRLNTSEMSLHTTFTCAHHCVSECALGEPLTPCGQRY
jgi:hypothetical protein